VPPDTALCAACEAELLDPADRRYRYPFITCTDCGPRFTVIDTLPYDRERTSMRAFRQCPECLREYHDPADRRYRYPFINCTNCGPRYTIIDDIPYDRPKTSMRHFTMCAACQAEYDNPLDRRFHAQPNACPVCGPRVGLWDARREAMGLGDPIAAAAELIRQGKIVAVKGLGGYHLAADAMNAAAVARLRERKLREEKPFAVMSPDLEAMRTYAVVEPGDEKLLLSIQRPIVLLLKKKPHLLAEEVAPGNPHVGAMLPYTPLHHLLLREGFAALVMTSGNLSEEPIAIDNDDAFERLAGIADFFLVHNRDIYLRSDDSVVRRAAGATRFMRRSRGYVPVPVFLTHTLPPVLACGAELKNTVCIAKGDKAFISQHIGDLENLATYEFFQKTVAHMQRILGVRPEVIACDLHPDYLSTRWADEQEAIPKVRVQHHHAHIVSGMAEHQLEGTVIGIACDGTGYGPDGTVWGGEVLVADAGGFERAAHLACVPMPGSAAAIKEPWRMAVSYLQDAFGAGLWGLDLPVLREAHERDDRTAATNLRTRTAYIMQLAADRPDQAREEVRQGMAQWSHDAFHAQHSWELYAIGEIEPFDIEVQPRDFMYPSEVAKDAEVVQVLEQGIRTMLNYEPKFSYSTAANDTGLFNHRGIQAINYGARDIRFQHTDHDLVALNNVFNAAKVFAFLGIHR